MAQQRRADPQRLIYKAQQTQKRRATSKLTGKFGVLE
jgi:hypothetical protein